MFFSAIHLSFLIVGHTHEDIDQVFSGVSAHLKKNSAYTLGDLEQAVYNNNRDVVPVTQLKRMLDYNSWLHCDTTSSYHSLQLSLWLPTLPDEGIIILKKTPPEQYRVPNATKFDS